MSFFGYSSCLWTWSTIIATVSWNSCPALGLHGHGPWVLGQAKHLKRLTPRYAVSKETLQELQNKQHSALQWSYCSVRLGQWLFSCIISTCVSVNNEYIYIITYMCGIYSMIMQISCCLFSSCQPLGFKGDKGWSPDRKTAVTVMCRVKQMEKQRHLLWRIKSHHMPHTYDFI